MWKIEKIAGYKDGGQIMSQKNYDVVKGIAQAAANAYDGALDENVRTLEEP